MYCLCRRGHENLREMKKNTFRIATDATGRRFMYPHIDENDKNHKENADPNDTVAEGSMYERAGSHDRPVKSFEKCTLNLNSRNNCLWQGLKTPLILKMQFGIETRHWVKIH